MKKNWYYLFLSMAIMAMPLTSCSNDDDEVKPNEEERLHDPTSDADQTPVRAFDALDWLQGSLVTVDENGEMVNRVYGKPLDRSDTTVIYIPVQNLADAEKKFLSWVAPGKDVIQIDGGYDYTLTDTEGNNQGAVSFLAENGGKGEIAHMTVAPGTDLKLVNEVKFINAESWPENDEIPVYEAGKTYKIYAEKYEWTNYVSAMNKKEEFKIVRDWLEFYCLQGNDNGEDAILVWISPDDDTDTSFKKHKHYYIQSHPWPSKYIAAKVYERLPSLAQGDIVKAFYKKNHDAWQKMLDVMDSKGYQWSADDGFVSAVTSNSTGNSEFLFNYYFSLLGIIECLDFDDEEEALWDYVFEWSKFEYRYMHIRTFPPATK